MLTDDIKKKIEAEIEHHPDRRSAAVDAMLAVQNDLGWLSDDVLARIGEFLGMTAEELDSLATFYNRLYRKPVGKYVILVCDSVSCWIMGYNEIRDHLKATLGIRLGETTADGRFTLLPTQCLGACDKAPALMIGEELYTHLTPARLDEILAGLP